MHRGKEICSELKSVRRRIAEENNIPLEIPECTHQGPCNGSCPRCEAEVHYLERELARRISVGKVATVAGLTLALASPVVAQVQEPQGKKSQQTAIRCRNEQRYLVQGTIVDTKTKEPLPFCNVTVTPAEDKTHVVTPQIATTDFDGVFKMELPEGNYTLRVAYVGYKPIERSLKVTAKNDTIDLSMEATGQMLGMPEVIICGLYEKDLLLEMGPEGGINTEIEGVPLRIQY